MINSKSNTTFWHFDENRMLKEGHNAWESPDGGDTVGRNAFMYIFHPNEAWLKDTLMSCIKIRDDGMVQFYRYPNLGAETMSRDHVSAIILALYINRDYAELKLILDNLPLQLSRRYWQTVDFWLWQKALDAEINQKPIKRFILRELFFGLNLIMFAVTMPWNFIIRTLLSVKTIEPREINEFNGSTESKWKQWIYQKLLYPQFSLYNTAWMVRSLKPQGSFLATILKLEARNAVIKAILGNEITNDEYESYTPISGFQWAGVLDQYIDQIPRKLDADEVKFNDLTKANLDYFYFGLDKIMLNSHDKIIEKIKTNHPLIFY